MFPSPMKREVYEQISNLQYIINELVHKASEDSEFIKECLKNIIKSDPFWDKLFQLYLDVSKSPFKSPFKMGVHRKKLK